MGKLYDKIGAYTPSSAPVNKKLYDKIGGDTNDINGAQYLGGKVVAGAVSIGKGAWNFIAGTFDQIMGDTYSAEKRYAENSARAFSEKLDEQYNANGAMKFLGAVGEGVGQFIPTALISMIPVAGVPLAQGIQFAGYTGMNVEDAYKKTGNLGAREYIYGAAMGGFETALEFVGGKAGGWLGKTKVGGKLLGVSDNVGKVAAKATSGKLGAKGATILGRTVVGGASEFTEEFIEAYAEVGLQRALEIDPNASIKLGEALHAGAVGFASGAAISGTASVLNTKGAQMTGARIMKAGEVEMTIAAATEISTAFKANGRVESGVHKMLADNLSAWADMKDKTTGSAQMVLGNIEVCMNVLSAMAKQQGTVRAVNANPEKFLPYAKTLFGDAVTVEDLKSPDSRVVRFIAASNWATGEADALAIRAKRSRFESAISAEMAGGQALPSITKFEKADGDAVYSSPDGDYVILSKGKNGLYTVMKGKDLDNLRAFEKDGSTAIDESEVQAALTEMLRREWSGASASQAQSEGQDQTNPSLAESEGEKAPETPTEKKGKESDKESPKNPAEEENAGEKPEQNVLSNKNSRERARLIDEYDADVQDKARKVFKDVDKLSADRRIAVYEAIRTGKNVEKDVLSAACYFISKRPGLFIRFSEKVDEEGKKSGFRKVVFGGRARLALAAKGPKGLRKVLIHEIFHDIADTAAGKKLIEAAMESVSAEMSYNTARIYGEHYANVHKDRGVESFEKFFEDGKYNKEDGKSVTDAISAYEKKYEGILPKRAITEEIVADVMAEVLGNEKFLKMAKDTGAAGLVLRGVRRMLTYLKTKKEAKPLYAEAVEFENLFLDAVGQYSAYTEDGVRYALAWEDAIDKLDSNALDTEQNTHLGVLDHTPQIYLEKAGAKDRKIVMSWDIAYLAMKKYGHIAGNYHGLGADVMKALPQAIEDPLFIVKQKNGRIAAITKIVVKGKRAVFASIELEAFKTTIQDGKSEANTYNLVVTVTDAKPNYLQNTIFDGEIVYNKNEEDPAHFILRLKSLKKAAPTYDRAGSSVNSIPQNAENVNTETENNLDETRFSLNETPAEATVRRANAAKTSRAMNESDKARLGRGWFYRKKDVGSALDQFLRNGYFVDEYTTLGLKNKDLDEVSSYLWEQMNKNDPEKIDHAATVTADYMIARMVVENAIAAEGRDRAKAIRRILKPYHHNMSLDESRRAELRAVFGKDMAQRFINLFSSGQRKGIDIDADAADINAQLESAELYDWKITTDNDKDALIGFAEMYFKVRELEMEPIYTSAESLFSSEEDIADFRAKTKEAILEAMEKDGKPGTLRAVITDKEASYNRLYERYRETRKKYEGAVKTKYSVADAVFLAKEVGEMVSKRKYVNAADIITPEMEEVGKTLASIATPRDLKGKEVRKVMKVLAAWYTPQNLDADSASENGEAIDTSMYHPDIKEKMERIANGQENAQLTYEEIRDLAQVLSAVRKVIQNYDMVTLNGHRVRATEAATSETSMLREHIDAGGVGKGDKGGIIGKMFHNAGRAVGKTLKKNFLYKVMTPRQVIQSLEWYDENGVLTQAYNAIQDGVAGAGSDYADMMRPVMEFYDEHKKYEKRLSKTFIPYEGEEMTVGQAIALYMTTKREQAALGFEESGFRYMGKDGKVRHARARNVADIQSEIYAAFTAEDKEYIKIIETVYEQARDLKVKTDGEIFGYTNVEDGYYFPIARDTMEIAKKVSDLRQTMRDMAVVSNKSFNKNTVKGAKNALFISDVTMVTDAHAMGVAQYANLYMALSSWDRLWNKKIEGKNGEKISTRQLVGDQIWTGRNNRDIADAYFRQLFADIQGVREQTRTLDTFYANLRSTYVSAALGFNLSSILKQTGSFGSALLYLSAGDLARGLGMNWRANREQMWKYSKVANGRMFDKGRFARQGANVTAAEQTWRGVKEFGEMTMAGVEGMDNWVVGRLWNACQQNIARTKGLAIGSEENLIAAGKLLDTVINETQSTSTADTRSAMQRGGLLAQSFSMFTSDAVKQVSYLFEGAARVYCARLRRKMGKGSDAEVKAANRFLRRSIASFVASTAIVVAITQLIKWLLGREREEDESVIEDIGEEALGQVLSILPIASDIYGKIANNYDVGNLSFDAINGVLDGVVPLMQNLSKLADGELVTREDMLKPVRKTLYELGNFTGVPIRNFFNYFTGTLGKFSPEVKYAWDALFEAPAYEADIAKAIERGDEDLAVYIMELSLKHRLGEGSYTSPVAQELLRLQAQGFADENDSVDPPHVPSSVDGVSVNAEQYKQMSAILSKSGNALYDMMASDAYNDLSDDERVDAINVVYRTYLNLAKAKVMPDEEEKRTATVWASQLFGDAQSYAALGKISQIESTDTQTRSQQVTAYLNDLDMSNDERYLVLFAAGYRSKTVLSRVRKLIAKSDKLTDEEKKAFEKQYFKD